MPLEPQLTEAYRKAGERRVRFLCAVGGHVPLISVIASEAFANVTTPEELAKWQRDHDTVKPPLPRGAHVKNNTAEKN